MLEDILTWIGAALGVTVLLVMAFGAVALDLVDVRGPRRAEGNDSPAR
ncbi:hypothetical protein [Saccharomonospora piscinae]|nr:hypothetical protein [Saccharomonospora piscinae]